SGDFGNEVRPPVTVIAQYLHIVASLQMAEESHTRPRPAAIERTPSLRPIHGRDHWKDRCNTDTSRNEKIGCCRRQCEMVARAAQGISAPDMQPIMHLGRPAAPAFHAQDSNPVNLLVGRIPTQ